MKPVRSFATTAAFFGIAAGVVGLTAALMLLFGASFPEPVLVAVAAFCAAAGLGMMIFLGLYMYHDARARGMNGALAALLLFLVGPPALVIYLLVRPARLAPPEGSLAPGRPPR